MFNSSLIFCLNYWILLIKKNNLRSIFSNLTITRFDFGWNSIRSVISSILTLKSRMFYSFMKTKLHPRGSKIRSMEDSQEVMTALRVESMLHVLVFSCLRLVLLAFSPRSLIHPFVQLPGPSPRKSYCTRRPCMDSVLTSLSPLCIHFYVFTPAGTPDVSNPWKY